MKKYSFAFAILAILICTGIAAAGTRLFKDGSKQMNPIQNVTGQSAVPAASRCDTVSSTTPVLKNYTAAGYIGIKANAYNHNTGAPVVVKWSEDGKQVWVGSDYSATNNLGTAYSTLKAAVFSGGTTAFCVRRH